MSAWARVSEDLDGRKTGVYSSFVNTLAEHFPHVLKNMEIYRFSQAATQPFKLPNDRIVALNPYHTDMRERVLVHLFDISTVLNRQSGVFYSSYVPQQTA